MEKPIAHNLVSGNIINDQELSPDFSMAEIRKESDGLKRRSMNLICAAEKVLRSCRLYGRKAEYYAVDGYRTP